MTSPRDGWHEANSGDVRWWTSPVIRNSLLGSEGLRLTTWLQSGRAVIVKQGPHRIVYRVALHDGHAIYIKHNLLPNLRAWLRQLVRPSKARMELHRAVAVANRGVPTVEPLALGERQAIFGAGDSFLVTRGLDDTQTLLDFIVHTMTDLPAQRRTLLRLKLAVALGKFIARLHEAGIRHADLHPGNVLVELTGAHEILLYLIDLDAVRLKPPLSWPAARENLVLVSRWFMPRVNRSDRMRFWRAYFEARGMGIWIRGRANRDHLLMAREMEKHAHHSTLSFWKTRDLRYFYNNRYFRRIRSRGLTGHTVADFDPKLLAELLADPDAPFRREDARVYKNSRSSTVVELECVHNGIPRQLIFKRMRAKAWARRWTSLFQLSAALRSWRFGHCLLERCLPTARPLLVLHRMKGGLQHDAYLVTEKIENGMHLQAFVASLSNLPVDDARQRLRSMITTLARTIKRMHEYRLSHRDMKASNFLVASDSERAISPYRPAIRCDSAAAIPGPPIPPVSPIWLIDLVGVSLHSRLSRRRRMSNLTRLHASFRQSRALTRTDKLRFLRGYLRWNLVGRGDWKAWWRQIEAATSRKVAQNEHRGRILT